MESNTSQQQKTHTQSWENRLSSQDYFYIYSEGVHPGTLIFAFLSIAAFFPLFIGLVEFYMLTKSVFVMFLTLGYMFISGLTITILNVLIINALYPRRSCSAIFFLLLIGNCGFYYIASPFITYRAHDEVVVAMLTSTIFFAVIFCTFFVLLLKMRTVAKGRLAELSEKKSGKDDIVLESHLINLLIMGKKATLKELQGFDTLQKITNPNIPYAAAMVLHRHKDFDKATWFLEKMKSFVTDQDYQERIELTLGKVQETAKGNWPV